MCRAPESILVLPVDEQEAATKARFVRIPVAGIDARLGSVVGRVRNISASGALLQVDEEFSLDSEWLLTFDLAAESVTLKARVVRSTSSPVRSMREERPGWLVAVTFVDLSPTDARAVRRLIALCMEAGGAV
jgi:hypothetical protein